MLGNPGLAALTVFALVGCGSGQNATSDQGPEAPPAEVAQAPERGTGDRDHLAISSRTYTSGTVAVKVTGAFAVDASQTLNVPASITDDGQTWLQYGESGAAELNVLFTNSEELREHGVNIAVGTYTVTAPTTEGECRTSFDVTATSVSGHYSCNGSATYDKATGGMGNVDIEVEFDARS